MKIRIYKDEMYPVYFVDESDDPIGTEYDIDEAVASNYTRAQSRFWAARQDLVEAMGVTGED